MPQYTNDDAIRFKQLFERLRTRRAVWDGSWEALAALMRPLRLSVRSKRAQGQQQTQNIFDGTAPKAASDLASALMGSLSPVDMQWFHLVMSYKPLNEDYDVQAWLQESEQRMNLAFRQSNFEGEFHELFQDLVVFGTGCILVQLKPSRTQLFGGFLFHSTAPGRYAIMEAADGSVASIQRVLRLSLQSIEERWPGTMSDTWKAKLTKQPDEQIDVLHTMRPVPDSNPVGRRPYEGIYQEFERPNILGQQYHRMFRFLVPRWSKASDEEYGRGQGHIAYPDVATLNRAVEMRLKQWAKAIDPPVLTIDDGVIGKLRLRSGERTVVRSDTAVRPFETGAKFDVAQFQEADLKLAIRNTFYADKLQLPAKQYMTAYEIQQQVEIMQRELGPAIGRIKHELLNPLISNAFDLMLNAGVLPEPPLIIMEYAQRGLGGLDVQYESPLTRSQRTSELVAIDRTVQAIAPFAEAHPEVIDNFDLDFIARNAGEVAGLPTQALRPIELVAEMREQKLKEAEEERTAALDEQGSKTAKNIGMTASNIARSQGQQGRPAQNAARP